MLPVFFAAGFMAAGIALSVSGLRRLAAAMASRTWPAASGSVSRSGLRTTGASGRRQRFEAEVQAVYEVDGIVYACRRVSLASGRKRGADDAQAVLDKYPAGSTVPVYYNPSNLRESLLEPGFSRRDWILPALGALLGIAGLLILIRTLSQSG
ncbi:DUF3592 domain-containing protein [bacterium]|nr:DUF3592 domain-containing protein [bacterium]